MKRLARKIDAVDSDSDSEHIQMQKPGPQSPAELFILQYTPKSIVVMGNTLSHSDALVSLGGTYNTGLKIGPGWVFAKIREESVQKYIDTGLVEKYVYSNTEKSKWNKVNTPAPPTQAVDNKKLHTIFQQMRDAFDPNEEYDGHNIIDVVNQLENIHLASQTKN